MMLSTILRVACIVVGVATLLRLATMEGLVTYDTVFQAFMDRLQGIVELGWLTDLIEPALLEAFELVRSFSIRVPELQPEWRPVSVLSGLCSGAFFRNRFRQYRAGWGLPFILSLVCSVVGAGIAGLTSSVFAGLFGAAAVAALASKAIITAVAFAAAVIAVSAASQIVVMIFCAVLFLTSALLAGEMLIDNFRHRSVNFLRDMLLLNFYLRLMVVTCGALAFILGMLTPVQALATLASAVCVACIATFFILRWLDDGMRGNAATLDDPDLNFGLDVLATMGLAVTLAVTFADPPLSIW